MSFSHIIKKFSFHKYICIDLVGIAIYSREIYTFDIKIVSKFRWI